MKNRILVVEDEQDQGELMCELLVEHGYDPVLSGSVESALAELERAEVAAIVSDVRMPGLSGIELCRRLEETDPDLPVILTTGAADVQTAIAALRAGAWDFMVKPVSAELAMAAVGRAVQHWEVKRELRGLREAVEVTRPVQGILGESPAIHAVTEMVLRIAGSDASVLITGESGTGKELIAQAIHREGPRAEQPFVALNCGAVPSHLLESELFGHLKGSFTDARRDRPGLFVQAGSGTLFLDEIGEMPLDMQVKLLRVLQEHKVRPIGGDEERSINARIVCATNRDLEAEVEAGRFRADLYYRINVVTIDAPPLRSRGSDILLLASHFLQRVAQRTAKNIDGISVEAARMLLDYDWPGNVRELENCIERAVALCRQRELNPRDLPAKIREHQSTRVELGDGGPKQLVTLAELEGRYVRQVLAACNGNKTHAARVLGIDRRSLYRRLEEPTARPSLDAEMPERLQQGKEPDRLAEERRYS